MRPNLLWYGVPFVCLLVSVTLGDEVIFKSGDRLTGTVKSVAEDKMTFKSAVAGTVTLKMADIKTFSTDTPVDLALTDGKVSKQMIAAGADGQVTVSADAAQPKRVALTDILKISTEKPKWTGAVVAGAVLSRGNTESSSASVGADAMLRTERTRTTLGAGYNYANQRDNDTRKNSTSADEWFAKGKYDYFIYDKTYFYGNIKYEQDRIADLDRRVAPGTGMGYQWVEKPDFNFFTEGGFSYVNEKYSNPEETRSYAAARLAYHLDKTFNSHVKGFHNLEFIPDLEDRQAFLVDTDVGLRTAITERMFVEAKARMAYNAQPADNREKKDLRYTLGVGWTF